LPDTTTGKRVPEDKLLATIISGYALEVPCSAP
jgi:hypothetical protein